MRTLTAAMLAAGLALMMPAAEAAGPATVTGTLSLKLTIKIVSNIPASTPIQCSLSAYASGSSASGVVDSIEESDTLDATRSGATAVCQMVIPYQWILYGTADTVGLSYSINAENAAGNGRSSSVSFETIPVPRSGATTAYSLTARI
ncbi:MAG: hypothetical protein ACREE2_10265 [Stellaceae bacterium]